MRHKDDESAANRSYSEFSELLQNVGRRSGLRLPSNATKCYLGQDFLLYVEFFPSSLSMGLPSFKA